MKTGLTIAFDGRRLPKRSPDLSGEGWRKAFLFMPKPEYKLLREYRKLSLEGKGEGFQFVRWLRDLEARERLGRKSKRRKH